MTSTSDKCPVCGDPIGSESQSAKVGSKAVLVCCDDCAKEVKANPQKSAAHPHD